jgi:ferredoxin
MAKHLTTHEKCLMKREGPFLQKPLLVCKECGKECLGGSALANHVKTHAGKVKLSSERKAEFSRWQATNAAAKVAAAAKASEGKLATAVIAAAEATAEFGCDVCGKACKTGAAIANHIKTHKEYEDKKAIRHSANEASREASKLWETEATAAELKEAEATLAAQSANRIVRMRKRSGGSKTNVPAATIFDPSSVSALIEEGDLLMSTFFFSESTAFYESDDGSDRDNNNEAEVDDADDDCLWSSATSLTVLSSLISNPRPITMTEVLHLHIDKYLVEKFMHFLFPPPPPHLFDWKTLRTQPNYTQGPEYCILLTIMCMYKISLAGD